MNKLRFNDKELSFVAQESASDREGLLEKKGAVKGQGELSAVQLIRGI